MFKKIIVLTILLFITACDKHIDYKYYYCVGINDDIHRFYSNTELDNNNNNNKCQDFNTNKGYYKFCGNFYILKTINQNYKK